MVFIMFFNLVSVVAGKNRKWRRML